MFEDGIKAGLAIGAICCIMIGFFCYFAGKNSMQAEAVRESKAAYHVVDEYGRTEFRWNK